MFFVGEVVKPSGHGRTATWEGMVGTVTRVVGRSVFVQWHNVAVEDELDCEEVVSTGTFNEKVPHHARVLGGRLRGTRSISDAGLVALYPPWRHELAVALIIMLVPTLPVSRNDGRGHLCLAHQEPRRV
jgi:hypothetical protein